MRGLKSVGFGAVAAVLAGSVLCCKVNQKPNTSLEQRVVSTQVQPTLSDDKKIEEALDYAKGLRNKLYDDLQNRRARDVIRDYNSITAIIEALPESERKSEEEKIKRYTPLVNTFIETLALLQKARSYARTGRDPAVYEDSAKFLMLRDSVFPGLNPEEQQGASNALWGLWAEHERTVTGKPAPSSYDHPYLGEAGE